MKEFDAAKLFDDYLDLRDVFAYYGYPVNRANFACCPFHREKTPSCSVSRLKFYCFGCHKKGNIVSFVEQLFEIDFKTAVQKIDDDFNLRLLGESRLTPEQEEKIRRRKLETYKKTKAEKEMQEIQEEYFEAWKHYILYRPPKTNLNIDSDESNIDQFWGEIDDRWLAAVGTINRLDDYAFIHNFKIDECMAEQMYAKGEI